MAFGWDDAIGIGASLAGGLFGDDGASEAAAAQAQATKEANALHEKQYNQTRSDLAPYRNLGAGGTNLLAKYLGINMPSGAAAASEADRNAIRARLLSQFTSGSGVSAPTDPTKSLALFGNISGDVDGSAGWEGRFTNPPAAASTVDEVGLNAAIEAELAKMYPASDSSGSAEFGSLLKNFTGQDLASEPGYQFGLNQGMRAVNNRLASGGKYFSGAALKGATQYANDYASTKFNDAFQRDAANKGRIYNFLTGAVGTGQNAAAMTGQSGSNMVNQVGANLTNMGNAQGAASIASGNAWNGAIQNAVGGYQQNELMNKILAGNSGFGGGESWRTSGNGMPAGY